MPNNFNKSFEYFYSILLFHHRHGDKSIRREPDRKLD